VIEKVEKERKALEMALHSRKMQANQAEIDHIRTAKQKLLDSRLDLMN